MSYTYPEALSALESIANDYIKILRPNENAPVRLKCDPYAQTASVTWEAWQIEVTMPVRPATSQMLQAEFEDWIAYMLHELGHPTHTNKSAWHHAVRLGVSRMVNALEDVRMEKALIASGIVPNARRVLSRLISRKVVEARANAWKPNARSEFGWTVCVLGRAANGYDIDASDLSWIKAQIKPGSTVATVLGWAMPALAACQSTSDCVTLAEKIMAALKTPQTGQPGEGESQPGEGEGQPGEQDEGEGEGEGEGKGESEGEGEGKQGKPSGEADEGKGEGEGEGEGKGEGEGERDGEASNEAGDTNAGKGGKGHGTGATDDDETPITDENDLTEHSLAPEGETMEGAGANTERSVIDILRSRVITDSPRNGPNPRMGVAGTRLRDCAAKASKQRAVLARALRSNETNIREGGRRAGRLDRGALARASAGATNIFERRTISKDFDTDVCILLDASGSMAGANMASALEVGLVVSQAAASVGASCTVEVFNSQGYIRAGGLASKRTPNPAEFGALVSAATGGTPLSAHMARAAVNQAKRAPQKRRVLFVVTDGGCDYGPQTVKRMANYLERSLGTVMAHVSIATPLQGSFRAEVCVPCGAALSEIGLEHFVKVLQAL
jgi:Mg-chelatase subunit ChlD